ncbi:MAG: hypothetical protein ACE5KW_06335, partial [Dehalococcoidia bacterium]
MARRKIDSVLEECLSGLLEGRLSIEECKALYPDLARELEPLLRTALDLSSAYQLDPSPDFARRAHIRFLQACASHRAPPQPEAWGLWRRASIALSAALSLAILALVGTTLLKEDNNGGSLLSINTVSAQTERARANLETLESALRQGQAPHPAVIHELQVATSQLVALAEAGNIAPEEVASVVDVANKQQSLLTEVRDQLPAESQDEADQALAGSEEILELVGVTPTPSSTPAVGPSPSPSFPPTPAPTPTPALSPTPKPTP